MYRIIGKTWKKKYASNEDAKEAIINMKKHFDHLIGAKSTR